PLGRFGEPGLLPAVRGGKGHGDRAQTDVIAFVRLAAGGGVRAGIGFGVRGEVERRLRQAKQADQDLFHGDGGFAVGDGQLAPFGETAFTLVREVLFDPRDHGFHLGVEVVAEGLLARHVLGREAALGGPAATLGLGALPEAVDARFRQPDLFLKRLQTRVLLLLELGGAGALGLVQFLLAADFTFNTIQFALYGAQRRGLRRRRHGGERGQQRERKHKRKREHGRPRRGSRSIRLRRKKSRHDHLDGGPYDGRAGLNRGTKVQSRPGESTRLRDRARDDAGDRTCGWSGKRPAAAKSP